MNFITRLEREVEKGISTVSNKSKEKKLKWNIYQISIRVHSEHSTQHTAQIKCAILYYFFFFFRGVGAIRYSIYILTFLIIHSLLYILIELSFFVALALTTENYLTSVQLRITAYVREKTDGNSNRASKHITTSQNHLKCFFCALRIFCLIFFSFFFEFSEDRIHNDRTRIFSFGFFFEELHCLIWFTSEWFECYENSFWWLLQYLNLISRKWKKILMSFKIMGIGGAGFSTNLFQFLFSGCHHFVERS